MAVSARKSGTECVKIPGTTSPRRRGGAVRADAESCRRPDDGSTGVDRQEWRTRAQRADRETGKPSG
ncbi:hypothetical protein GCM10027028_45010 [Streptomyces sundarbansensis]